MKGFYTTMNMIADTPDDSKEVWLNMDPDLTMKRFRMSTDLAQHKIRALDRQEEDAPEPYNNNACLETAIDYGITLLVEMTLLGYHTVIEPRFTKEVEIDNARLANKVMDSWIELSTDKEEWGPASKLFRTLFVSQMMNYDDIIKEFLIPRFRDYMPHPVEMTRNRYEYALFSCAEMGFVMGTRLGHAMQDLETIKEMDR